MHFEAVGLSGYSVRKLSIYVYTCFRENYPISTFIRHGVCRRLTNCSYIMVQETE